MDLIEFEPVPHSAYGLTAGIFVNSISLISLVEAFEFPRYGLDSEYSGLPLMDLQSPLAHFTGRSGSNLYGPHVQLLGCSCGVPDCWPLLCQVTVGVDLVVWSDFQQPFRRPGSAGGHWSYDGFGPFEFSRHQYETALRGLTREPGQ